MVIMPAFTKRQQRHPKAISRIIPGAEAPASPHMRGGVDQPCGMEPDHCTKEDTPEDVPPSANCKEQDSQYGDRHPVPPADPPVESVFAKFWNVGQKISRVALHGLTGKNPAHMGPKASVKRRMRVALSVCILVMQAMGCNPE